MNTRMTFVLLAALIALVPAGCRRAANTPTPSAAPVAPVPTPTGTFAPSEPERTDYRTLSKSDLENLIRTKTGVESVTLVPRALYRYSGTIMAPGGTPLPLEVTVEAERIVCDTITPAGSTSQVITPRGLEPGRPDIK
jgi:hypothetical protein